MKPTTYTVQKGDTLNKIAQSYGYSNYKEAGLKTASGNPDLIKAGEVISISNPKNPLALQSTTAYRTQTQSNGAKFNEIKNNLGLNAPTENNGGGSGQVSVTKDILNPDGTRTVSYSDGSTAQVQSTKNADGSETYKEISKDFGKNKKELSDDEQERQDIDNAELDAKGRIDKINKQMESLKMANDNTTNALISSIQGLFGARIEEMKTANKMLLETKKQVGIRQGRGRYAPVLHEGILTNEEEKGIQRVTTLQAEMINAIAKAEQARTTNNTKLFNDAFNQVDKVYGDLKSEIATIHKTVTDKNNAIITANREKRAQDKQDFDQMLDLSKRSAPSVAKALAGFDTDEERSAFIEAYSQKTGIDADILLGDIEDASFKDTKNKLDLENIRNQIANRNDQMAKRKSGDTGLDEDFDETDPTGADSGQYVIEMTEDIASEFEKIGLSTEDIVNLQYSLNAGNSVDDIIKKASLDTKQSSLIKKYAKKK